MEEILKDIKGLKIQGAREVAKAGLRYLKSFAKKTSFRSKKEMLERLNKESRRLIGLRPTEPALRNSLASLLVEVQKAPLKDTGKLKKLLIRLCDEKTRDFDVTLERVSEIGSNMIGNGDTILTHCHSHIVVEIFRKAKLEGKEFTVLVTETRPRNQGLLTLKDLLKSNIKTIYCVDSAIGHVMKQATNVLAGCDAILPDGSCVNKIGTLPLAIVARHFGKPLYIAGETIKFTDRVELENRPPQEVLDPGKFPKAEIINPAFDVVPAECITEIITEKGAFRPEMVRKSTL